MMGAWGMGPMMNMMGGMGKGMGKMGKGSPMGQMGGGGMGGKGMSKGNMVWQPQFMKKGMGPMGMGGPMAMGKGMMWFRVVGLSVSQILGTACQVESWCFREWFRLL